MKSFMILVAMLTMLIYPQDAQARQPFQTDHSCHTIAAELVTVDGVLKTAVTIRCRQHTYTQYLNGDWTAYYPINGQRKGQS